MVGILETRLAESDFPTARRTQDLQVALVGVLLLTIQNIKSMVKRLIEKLLEVFSLQKEVSCDCGDPGCTRRVKSTKDGGLYVENHFTCGNVKEVVSKCKNF